MSALAKIPGTVQRTSSSITTAQDVKSRNEQAVSLYSSTPSIIPEASTYSAPSSSHPTARVWNRRYRGVRVGSNKSLLHRIPLVNRQHRKLHSLLNYSPTQSTRSVAKSLAAFIGYLLDWRAHHDVALRELITPPPNLPIQHLSGRESPLPPVQAEPDSTLIASSSSIPEPTSISTCLIATVAGVTQGPVPVGPRPRVAPPRRFITAFPMKQRPITPATSGEDPLPPPEVEAPRTNPPSGDRLAEANERCTVCLSESRFLPVKPPAGSCKHQSQVCRPCLARTIETVVLNGDPVDGMRCPTLECRQLMSYNDVEFWSRGLHNATTNQVFERDTWNGTRGGQGNDLFDRYQRALLRNHLVRDEAFVWCTGEGCHSGQYHTSGNDRPLLTCNACGNKQCFRHKVAWHEGYTCLQWDIFISKSAYTNDLSHKKIISITKACPGKDCKQRIEKNGGCFTMTCARPRGCGTYFCWECLAPNCIHYDACVYYSGKPGGNPSPHKDQGTASFRATISKRNPQRLPLNKRWNFKFWEREKEANKPIRGDPLAFKLSRH